MHKRIFKLGLLLFLTAWMSFCSFSQPIMALTEEQQLISQVWRIVNRTYVDETFNHQNWHSLLVKTLKQQLPDRKAAYAVIQNMLKTLDDPFTRFLDPEQYRSLQVNTSGELTGIGLQIASNPKTGKLEVISTITGSPAEKAGLRPYDRIIEIGGVPIEEFTLDEAANRMRGPIGSLVTLLVERDEEEHKKVIIVRDHITLNPVIEQLKSSPQGLPIGYLRLTQFNANAAKDLTKAIANLGKKGAAGYILDLRNNPGGLLQSSVEVARLWLNFGTIVYTTNRRGILDSFESFGTVVTQDPLVVLVNEGTASASEILAGALQDNGRAQLVGETTFGKGLVQSLFELRDGSGLAVTTAKYETPKHHNINKLGIKPDKLVHQAALQNNQIATSEDLQYEAALELLKKLML